MYVKPLKIVFYQNGGIFTKLIVSKIYYYERRDSMKALRVKKVPWTKNYYSMQVNLSYDNNHHDAKLQ